VELAVELKNITKVFPGIIANDRISLDIKKGEVFAIVGENGAGKTTLMNIIYGLYTQDSGEIYIFGKKIIHNSPGKAIEMGIGMVHQHFMLIPKFTVAENIILGEEFVKSGIVLDIKRGIEEVRKISEKYGLKVEPNEKVGNLPVGIQQRVEILKVLFRGAKILILDEPTAVLTPQEAKELFETINALKSTGKTVIFISHKLREVLEIADRIAVFKNGKLMGIEDVKGTTERELARLMVGRDVVFEIPKKEKSPGDFVLEIENLVVMSDKDIPAVKGISFKLRSSEILGFAGVEGNGQRELVEALTGLRPIKEGKILIRGREVKKFNPWFFRESGVAHIPEDRRDRGLVLPFTVAYNLFIGRQRENYFSKGIFLNRKNIDEFGNKKVLEYDIRPHNPNLVVDSLSGGNQQKVVVAREISYDPDILIAAQPTRGLDVGASEFVHHKLVEQRDSGKAVLLISFELDEIMMLSDRIAVLYGGEIVGELPAEKATEEELGLLMLGLKRYEKSEVAS
jgi:simple sugar transport system ATP-binding protein